MHVGIFVTYKIFVYQFVKKGKNKNKTKSSLCSSGNGNVLCVQWAWRLWKWRWHNIVERHREAHHKSPFVPIFSPPRSTFPTVLTEWLKTHLSFPLYVSYRIVKSYTFYANTHVPTDELCQTLNEELIQYTISIRLRKNVPLSIELAASQNIGLQKPLQRFANIFVSSISI